MVSSEIRNPQKNLPLALIGGTVGVIGIYLLANAAYFHVLAPREVAGATRVASDMMRRIFDGTGANAVAVAAMISIFAALNGSILTGARVPYAAARDGLFFHAMGRVHPQHHTPNVSILVLSGWAALLVLSGRYDDLYNMVIFASWILYGMSAAAVLVLRRKRPDLRRPYRTLGYPVVPILFVIVAIILLVSTAFERPRESFLGIGFMVIGLFFYIYWKRQASGSTERSY
jgi:amino acid transporter